MSSLLGRDALRDPASSSGCFDVGWRIYRADRYLAVSIPRLDRTAWVRPWRRKKSVLSVVRRAELTVRFASFSAAVVAGGDARFLQPLFFCVGLFLIVCIRKGSIARDVMAPCRNPCPPGSVQSRDEMCEFLCQEASKPEMRCASSCVEICGHPAKSFIVWSLQGRHSPAEAPCAHFLASKSVPVPCSGFDGSAFS
jgi:hypothetical protein